MAHGALTFKLARIAHGTRNQIETSEEARLQDEARKAREVLLPGVDIATAYAMVQLVVSRPNEKTLVHAKRMERGQRNEAISMRDLQAQLDKAESLQAAADTALAESGFAVFMHESWAALHHLVRYFDLIEKNEAPDTSLLEWLVSAGVVRARTALATVARFTERSTTLGRHKFKLDADDAMRVRIAAEVREQLEAEERAAQEKNA